MDEIDFRIPQQVLFSVAGTELFYPHSGQDLNIPIRLFAPYVSDFWFVDLAYFRSDLGGAFGQPADNVVPVLETCKNFSLHEVEIKGPPSAGMERREDENQQDYPYLEPCILTETYVHLPSKKRFRVHRRRGYSVSGFRKEITNLGIFFYRGDSSEGSNVPWLKNPFLPRILKALVDKGLIVTDGSRAWPNGRYAELRRFFGNRDIGSRAVQLIEDFDDQRGRLFKCIGYAGERYGPTLIWEVTRNSPGT